MRKSEKPLTQYKRRNAAADEILAGQSRMAQQYKDTRPLQGTLSRTSRCKVCGEWVLDLKDYNPARCKSCAEEGKLF